MKKLALLLLVPTLALGALTNIVVRPGANPDNLGEWATKINATIDQVNTNTSTIGGATLTKNPATAIQNMGTYAVTNALDFVTTNGASLLAATDDILELQQNAIASNVWDTVSALTNTAELVANKDQPNGYAGLDANGYINESAIDYILVVFAGAEAVDVP